MHRKFIALILGTAIAVAGASTAAPARASDDLAKALVGFAALALIGKAINDAKDDSKPTYIAPTNRVRNNQGVISRRATQAQKRPLPKRVSRFDLPRACLHTYVVPGRKNVRLLGAHCLRQNFAGFNRLPNECHASIRIAGKRQGTFKPGCLNRYGYRVARR